MSLVKATVGTVDPESECAECGIKMKDHKMVHRPAGIVKGMRGTCPTCLGPMHNKNDAWDLVQYKCIVRQVFGKASIEVTAANLSQMAERIKLGQATIPTNRAMLFAPPAPPAPAPVAAPAPAHAAAPSAAAASPAAGPTAPTAVSSAARATTPSSAPAAESDEEKKAKAAARKAAVRAALKGAKVAP